jgi:hypothetical protein
MPRPASSAHYAGKLPEGVDPHRCRVKTRSIPSPLSSKSKMSKLLPGWFSLAAFGTRRQPSLAGAVSAARPARMCCRKPPLSPGASHVWDPSFRDGTIGREQVVRLLRLPQKLVRWSAKPEGFAFRRAQMEGLVTLPFSGETRRRQEGANSLLVDLLRGDAPLSGGVPVRLGRTGGHSDGLSPPPGW